MEPVYVDNLTTASQAFFAAFKESVEKNDANFRFAPNGEEIQNRKTIMAAASHAANVIFIGMGMPQPRYCHIWIDKEKNFLVPTFPIDSTREELMMMCHTAHNFIAMMPVSQQETKDMLG